MKFGLTKSSLCLCLLLSLCACGGGGSSSGSAVTSPSATAISGAVSKGPFTAGYVKSYKVTANNTLVPYRTSPISNGTYSIDFGDYSGVVLLEAYGSYVDESTNQNVDLAQPLRAALSVTGMSGSIRTSITPLTDLAVHNAEFRGGLNPQNVNAANALVSDLFQFNILSTTPVKPESQYLLSPSTSDSQRCYTLILAGISKTAPNEAAMNNLINSYELELEGPGGRLSAATINTLKNNTQLFLQSPFNATGYASVAAFTAAVPMFSQLGYMTTQVVVSAVKANDLAGSTAQTVQLALFFDPNLTVEHTNGTPKTGVMTYLVDTTMKDAYLLSLLPNTPLNITIGNTSTGIPLGQLLKVSVKAAPGYIPQNDSVTVKHIYDPETGLERQPLVPLAANINSQVDWNITVSYE